MENVYSLEDLLDFLSHAGERGLMPTASAQALAVATRNVFQVLDDNERASLPLDDLDAIVRRFTNKRAKDFNPKSLKEYGRRVHRAVDLFLQWKLDPANFAVKTRATSPARKRERANGSQLELPSPTFIPDDRPQGELPVAASYPVSANGFQTAFPIRPGQVVTICNLPLDLSTAEVERLAQFIKLLATQ